MGTFGDYAYYYNLFYQDKDYAREACDVNVLLEQYKTIGKNIIIYGCGTGKHDRELSKLGYKCHGIDMSEAMVDIAKQAAKEGGFEIEYEVADIRKYEPTKKYDAVVSLFHVMSYQNSNEDILAAFISARKALDKGGLFLFDAWYGPGVLTDRPVVRIKEVEDDRYKLIRHSRPTMHANTNIVDVEFEIIVIDKETTESKIISEVHHMRYFFEPEMRFYLEQAGFKLLANVDCNTLKKADYNSWTNYYVAMAE